MAKAYIAAPFRRVSRRANPELAYGQVSPGVYTGLLESLEDVFLRFGFETCLPHRDEGLWGEVYYDPASISALCLLHVETSDVVCALPDRARGVHVELGFAARSPRTRLIVMYEVGTEPSTLVWGLGAQTPWRYPSASRTTVASFGNHQELLVNLEGILAANWPSVIPHGFSNDDVTVGLIDIGSHTLKLKISSLRSGRKPKVLQQAKNSIGLMKDVITHGNIPTECIEAVATQVKAWRDTCDDLDADIIKVAGTAALRGARNSSDVISCIEEKAGLSVEVLSPERELSYVAQAVLAEFPSETTEPPAILNIGGGSAQLLLCEARNRRPVYFDFGTHEIMRRWPWTSPMDGEAYSTLRDYVRQRLVSQLADLTSTSRLVHTGGELDFLLRCQVPMRTSHHSATHVSEVPSSEFEAFSREFSALHPQAVAASFGLDPAWASGAVASNVIASTLAELLGAEAIIPSNLNLSDGLIRSAAGASKDSLL